MQRDKRNGESSSLNSLPSLMKRMGFSVLFPPLSWLVSGRALYLTSPSLGVSPAHVATPCQPSAFSRGSSSVGYTPCSSARCAQPTLGSESSAQHSEIRHRRRAGVQPFIQPRGFLHKCFKAQAGCPACDSPLFQSVQNRRSARDGAEFMQD